VATLLQSLDCFVLPSETEGTSCTLQEAMSCGLPSVATAVGGTPDLLTEGLTGRLVPSGDAEAMAQALMHYMLNPPLARKHGLAARAQAQRDFGMDAMVGHYDRLFQSS
jgi:glycosyltransferase involved in cell wall biosynthesis